MTQIARRSILSLRARGAALARQAGAFATSRSGVAAIEAAFLLPVMVAMYFGLVFASVGYSAKQKVTRVARAAADLTGQDKTVDNAELNRIVGAAGAIMAPLEVGGMQVNIASFVVQSDSSQGQGSGTLKATVCWGQARLFKSDGTINQTPGTPPANMTPGYITRDVPPGYDKDTSYIVTRVSYPHAVVIGEKLFQFITGRTDATLLITDTAYWPVRNSTEVVYQNAGTTTKCL